MIKTATQEEVLALIDDAHEVKNLQQLASNASSDNVKFAASTKLLEFKGYGNKDKKITASGSNIQLVIEE